jgi:enterochelin esterase-like enzyme
MFLKPLLQCLVFITISISGFAQALPTVSVGRLVVLPQVASKKITSRAVYIWLPTQFSSATAQQFSVLYMHDGQMLFDSTITWNKDAWMVANVADSLQNTGSVKPFIIVGIANGGSTRHADYFPQDVFENLPPATQTQFLAAARGNGASVFNQTSLRANDYLQFLQQQVKPVVDSVLGFSTLPSNNYLMGSSMGGLISVYALCKQPHFWAGAACLSTHWPGVFTLENNPFPQAMLSYINTYLPPAKAGKKLYMDCGTATLDALYPAIQQQANTLIQQKGYGAQQFQAQLVPGAAHTEAAWRARLATPLLFLFSKK